MVKSVVVAEVDERASNQVGGEGETGTGQRGEKNVGLVLQKCKMNKNRFTDYTVLYFSFCADLRLVDRRQNCRVRNENIKKVRKRRKLKKRFL